MADEMNINNQKDNPDIYPLRASSALPERVIVPSGSGDIFAIKKENSSQLGALIGISLSEGVFLCQAYRLDKLLSRDEMGETWKASDLQKSRNVVIYLPPRDTRKDETAIEPIRKNSRHVEALEHPRIVPLSENFIDPEHGFFTVRKFVNGKTLDVYRKDYVKRHGKLAPTRIVKILKDIAHALDYVHGVDLVHGDLYLKNVILGLDDEVYIDNFALMPVRAATASVERKPYLSPEVIAGHTATAQSDVYALAVIAYNLLSGCLPYTSDRMENAPLPIPGIPSTADAVIRKAMEKEPDDRFNSCGDFAKALEMSIQESKRFKSVAVTPSSRLLTSKRPAKRKPTVFRLLQIAGGLLLGLCLLAVAEVWFANENSLVARNFRSLFLQNVNKRNVEQPSDTEPDSELQDGVVHVATRTAQTPHAMEEPMVDFAGKDNPAPPIEIPPVETPESVSVPEAPPVVPILDVPSVASEEPNGETDTTIEPDTPWDNDIAPRQAQEKPPLPDVDIAAKPESPQQIATVPPDASRRVLSVSPADVMREEGTTTSVPIGGLEYRFRWCTPSATNGFWIQETPVSQELWRTVMGSVPKNNPFGGRTQLPVVSVSWGECQQFVERLNATSDLLAGEEFDGEYKYRFTLPKVAQWDYAHPLGVITISESVQEWCGDENELGYRAVRNPQNWRISREQGYENVGFRLVIIP